MAIPTAPKPTIPQVIDKVGVPDGTVLNRLAMRREKLYAVCEVFEGF